MRFSAIATVFALAAVIPSTVAAPVPIDLPTSEISDAVSDVASQAGSKIKSATSDATDDLKEACTTSARKRGLCGSTAKDKYTEAEEAAGKVEYSSSVQKLKLPADIEPYAQDWTDSLTKMQKYRTKLEGQAQAGTISEDDANTQWGYVETAFNNFKQSALTAMGQANEAASAAGQTVKSLPTMTGDWSKDYPLLIKNIGRLSEAQVSQDVEPTFITFQRKLRVYSSAGTVNRQSQLGGVLSDSQRLRLSAINNDKIAQQ